jgi:hypothetical protein
MDAVKPADGSPLSYGAWRQAECDQLVQREDRVLSSSNLGDRSIPGRVEKRHS